MLLVALIFYRNFILVSLPTQQMVAYTTVFLLSKLALFLLQILLLLILA